MWNSGIACVIVVTRICDEVGAMKKLFGMALAVLLLSVLNACTVKEGNQEEATNNISEIPEENTTTDVKITIVPTDSVAENVEPEEISPTPTEKLMKKIDFADYRIVTFDGNNLAGWGTVSFDKEAYLLDNIHNVSFNEENMQVYREVYGNPNKSAAYELLKYIDFKLDKGSKLSNGESVEILWEIDSDKITNYFEVDYICSAKSFIVENLKDAETFDPFEELVINFTGVSPFVEVTVYSSGSQRGEYSVSPNSNLKNGDEFTVSFLCDDKSTMIDRYGEYPSCYEKTYTVSGRQAYIQSIDEIPDEQYEKLVNRAASDIWVLGYGLYEDAKYLGNVFFVAKDGSARGVQFLNWSGYATGNAVCMVFERPKEYYDVSKLKNAYTVIVIKNILIDVDGKIKYSADNIWEYETFDSKEEVREALLGVYDDVLTSTDNLLFE